MKGSWKGLWKTHWPIFLLVCCYSQKNRLAKFMLGFFLRISSRFENYLPHLVLVILRPHHSCDPRSPENKIHRSIGKNIPLRCRGGFLRFPIEAAPVGGHGSSWSGCDFELFFLCTAVGVPGQLDVVVMDWMWKNTRSFFWLKVGIRKTRWGFQRFFIFTPT